MKTCILYWVLVFLIFFLTFYIYVFDSFHVNGYEPDYDPEKWQEYQQYNNCYAYALDNHKMRTSKPQPADKKSDNYECNDLKHWITLDLVDNDGVRYPLIASTSEATCPERYRKIYLVSSGDDYHFYRQDKDSLWSHKPGSNKVTRRDAKGELIVDPSKADHNYGEYNYKTPCGFFCVPTIHAKF